MLPHQLDRFQLIHQHLDRGGAVPTVVLARYCGVSVRTLKEDLATMRLLYDAPICFDRQQRGYVYTAFFALKRLEVAITDREVVALRMAVAALSQFRAIDVFRSFRLVVDKLAQAVRLRTDHSSDIEGYLAFESSPVGQGSDLIEPILEACMCHQPITFQHRKYGEAAGRQRVVFPYAVKEHRNRWYVVGFDEERQQVRVFGLDRIEADSVVLLGVDHPLIDQAPLFNTGTYFRQALGVAVYDQPPEAVVLQLRSPGNHQFKAQPFYPYAPTDVLVDTPDELRVQLTIIINDELVYELARLGPSVTVVSPASLKQKLLGYLQAAIDQYVLGSP